MRNPAHPGAILRESVVGELGLNVNEAGKRLGISRAALSGVLNERAAISPSLAIRLERAEMSTARLWLATQTAYDLATAEGADRADPRWCNR